VKKAKGEGGARGGDLARPSSPPSRCSREKKPPPREEEKEGKEAEAQCSETAGDPGKEKRTQSKKGKRRSKSLSTIFSRSRKKREGRKEKKKNVSKSGRHFLNSAFLAKHKMGRAKD